MKEHEYAYQDCFSQYDWGKILSPNEILDKREVVKDFSRKLKHYRRHNIAWTEKKLDGFRGIKLCGLDSV